eukprot:TRINITY_DN6419_c0_g1_i1.p1 TRINITY_DN6419_c0_g1~~TRINITY_DN6419_c0_g1_i1.p1  ORF type:complete len:650 (+),score=190.49 TRINITY_DN6419_c0_g1_i1:228-2177(+)
MMNLQQLIELSWEMLVDLVSNGLKYLQKKKKDNKIQQHSQYQKNRPYYNRDSPKNHRRTGNGGFRDYKKYQSNGNTHPISTNGNTQQQLNRPAKENIQTAQPVPLENANPSLPPSTTPPAQSTPETNPTPLASTPTAANKPIESNNDKSINLPVQAVSDNKRDSSVESPKSPRFVPKKRFDGPSSPNPLRTSNGTQSPKSQKRSKLAKGRKEWKPKPKQEGSLQIGSPRDQDNSTTEELSTPEILNVTHHDESEEHSSDEDSDSSLITLPSHLVNREAAIKVRFRDSTPKAPQTISQPQNSTPKESSTPAEQPKEIPSQQPSQSQTTDKKESSSEVVSSPSTTSSTDTPVQPAVSPVQGSHPAYVGIRAGPRPLVSLENDSMGSIPIHFPLPNYMGPINPYPFDMAVPDPQMFYAPEHLQMASGFRGKGEAPSDPKSSAPAPDASGKFPSNSSNKPRRPNHSSIPNPNAPAASTKPGTPPDGSLPPAGYRPYPPQFAQAYPGAYSYPYLPSPGQFSQYPMRIPYYKGYPNYQNAAYPEDLAQDGGYPIPGYFPQEPSSALPPVHHVHHRGQNAKAKSGPVAPASNPGSSGSSSSASPKQSQPQGSFSAISGADLANGAGFKSSHHPQGATDGYQPNYYHPSADYNQYGH